LTRFAGRSAWAVEKTPKGGTKEGESRQSTEKWCPSRQVSGGAAGLGQLTIAAYSAFSLNLRNARMLSVVITKGGV